MMTLKDIRIKRKIISELIKVKGVMLLAFVNSDGLVELSDAKREFKNEDYNDLLEDIQRIASLVGYSYKNELTINRRGLNLPREWVIYYEKWLLDIVSLDSELLVMLLTYDVDLNSLRKSFNSFIRRRK